MSKKEIRPFWTTTVDPSEYNYRKQFSEAVKIANERKEIFAPLDIGKVWGLVESHARLERENAALRAELEAAKAFHRVAVAERDAARKEAQP